MELDGEWWLIDGTAFFMDGDIGDYNHEGYAIEHARMLAAEQLGMEWSVGDEWDYPDPSDYPEVDAELLRVANERSDARNYAMEEWGWKRVTDRDVETWTFTAEDRSNIIDGLWDAYPELEEGMKVWIHVLATGESLNLTIGELEYYESAKEGSADIMNDATIQYGRNQDATGAPSFYQGKLGD